jgi:hypothetical protein
MGQFFIGFATFLRSIVSIFEVGEAFYSHTLLLGNDDI